MSRVKLVITLDGRAYFKWLAFFDEGQSFIKVVRFELPFRFSEALKIIRGENSCRGKIDEKWFWERL